MATNILLVRGAAVRTFPHFVHDGEIVRYKGLMWIGADGSE